MNSKIKKAVDYFNTTKEKFIPIFSRQNNNIIIKELQKELVINNDNVYNILYKKEILLRDFRKILFEENRDIYNNIYNSNKKIIIIINNNITFTDCMPYGGHYHSFIKDLMESDGDKYIAKNLLNMIKITQITNNKIILIIKNDKNNDCGVTGFFKAIFN